MSASPPPRPPGTDATAIRASLHEPRAFVAVFDRHHRAVHGYVARRVGADLADEIAAETFARAFDRRAGYDAGHADARPWLLAIASNLLHRHWRTERRRLEAWLRSQSGRPVTEAVPEALAAGLVDELFALPEAEREALLLLAWGELSYEEIAQATGVPIGTVRSRISRARARLRDRLREPGPGHPAVLPLAPKESPHA
jgi:RNA polymerase sigma-70 factor (ECF subfamily)